MINVRRKVRKARNGFVRNPDSGYTFGWHGFAGHPFHFTIQCEALIGINIVLLEYVWSTPFECGLPVHTRIRLIPQTPDLNEFVSRSSQNLSI